MARSDEQTLEEKIEGIISSEILDNSERQECLNDLLTEELRGRDYQLVTQAINQLNSPSGRTYGECVTDGFNLLNDI